MSVPSPITSRSSYWRATVSMSNPFLPSLLRKRSGIKDILTFVFIIYWDSSLFQCVPCCVFQAEGATVGWAMGYMLNMTNMVPSESLGLMKALPPGPWAGILFLFIALLLVTLGYLLIIYRNTSTRDQV